MIGWFLLIVLISFGLSYIITYIFNTYRIQEKYGEYILPISILISAIIYFTTGWFIILFTIPNNWFKRN